MKYHDLRDFLAQLERDGEVKRIAVEVDPRLEMTEICDRVLKAGGPALLFEQPKGDYRAPNGNTIPVLGNLFGTPRRVAWAMGGESVLALREIGAALAALKEPEPPRGLKDAGRLMSLVKTIWDMKPKEVRGAACQEIVWEGKDVDLARLKQSIDILVDAYALPRSPALEEIFTPALLPPLADRPKQLF